MPMLKICLVSPPFSGHLNPLLGLGRALADIAEVTVISTPQAMKGVAAAGLKRHAILAGRESLIDGIANPGVAVKNNPLLLFHQLRANVSLQSEMRCALDEAFAVLKPDLVIADFTLPVAGPAAIAHGARWWTCTPSPCVFETPDGPPAYFGGLMPPESFVQKQIQWVLRKLTRVFKRLMFFVFRRSFRDVGLTSVYRQDGSERVYSPEIILGCGISEMEFSQRWPAHFHFIGPSLYTPPVAGSSPQFIAGKKHVLITLGSHLHYKKDEIAGHILSIARERRDLVFHFSDGTPGQTGMTVVENFHRYNFISYDEFLSNYDLVIHHGGSGILYHCLTHGIPALVIPLDFDQFDNAARLVYQGLAHRVKAPSEIRGKLAEIMKDDAMAKRCRAAASSLKQYHSGTAVRTLIQANDLTKK